MKNDKHQEFEKLLIKHSVTELYHNNNNGNDQELRQTEQHIISKKPLTYKPKNGTSMCKCCKKLLEL